MYYKIFFNIIIIFLVSVLQISFVSNLPFYFGQINLFFIVLLFVLSLFRFEYALWWSVGIGFILDTFSFEFFGVYLLSYFLVIVLINYLYKNYFTDRSLYSYSILIAISLVVYEFINNIFFYVLSWFGGQETFFLVTKVFWINLISSLVINLIAMSVLFYILSLLTEKLKPVFLIKK